MGELINLNPQVGIPDEIARDTEVAAAIATHVSALHPFPIFGFGQGVSTEDVFDFGSGFLDCRNGGGTFPPGMGHIQGFQARFAYMGGKWGMQLVTQNNINNECFFRTVNEGNWGPWRRIWNDGNFNPSNYLLKSEGDGRYRQSSVSLTDSDIPASMARDTEVANAIASHTGAVDPHSQYLTQAEGDERYVGGVKTKFLNGKTSDTKGTPAVTPHGLDITKIVGFSGIAQIYANNWFPFYDLGTPDQNQSLSLSVNETDFIVGNANTTLMDATSKDYRIVVRYID